MLGNDDDDWGNVDWNERQDRMNIELKRRGAKKNLLAFDWLIFC